MTATMVRDRHRLGGKTNQQKSGRAKSFGDFLVRLLPYQESCPAFLIDLFEVYIFSIFWAAIARRGEARRATFGC
jgi:hypothetical protein